MKNNILVLILLSLLSIPAFSQNKMLSNELRYWYPLQVSKSVIESQLKEESIKYSVENANLYIDGYDYTVKAVLGSPQNNQFPQVQYLIKENKCVVVNYFDRIENLNKWFAILSSAAFENDYTSNTFYGPGIQFRIFLDADLNLFQVHISNR